MVKGNQHAISFFSFCTAKDCGVCVDPNDSDFGDPVGDGIDFVRPDDVDPCAGAVDARVAMNEDVDEYVGESGYGDLTKWPSSCFFFSVSS